MELVTLALEEVRGCTSQAALARWRKQELAWTIARAEFTLNDSPQER